MARHLDDWLENYLRFTENSEPPMLYNLWSGIAAISSVLQRKCFSNWGLRGYIYPNFYIALVGPPGGRKGTAMKMAKNMVEQMDIHMGSDSLGSTQSLYQQLMEAEQMYLTADGKERPHKSVSVWSEEFQVFLNDRDPMFIGSLTDLFDAPNRWEYKTLKRGTENLANCWLSLIGAITPSLLQNKLNAEAVGGGLLSRIILVVGYGAKRRIALQFLSKEEKELQQKLTEDLQNIKLLTGPFNLTQSFLNAYQPWYENQSDRDGLDSNQFLGYNARRALHLNKLCMIMSASESDSMEIKEHHFQRALIALEATEAHMPNAFYGIGYGRHADANAKLLKYVQSNQQVNYAALANHLQMDVMTNELDQLLSMGEKTGRLKIETSVSGDSRIHYIEPKTNTKEVTYRLNKTFCGKMKK